MCIRDRLYGDAIVLRAIYAATHDELLQTACGIVMRAVSKPHVRQMLGVFCERGKSTVRKELFALVPVMRDAVRQHPDVQKRADAAAAVFKMLRHVCDVVKRCV